MASVMEASEAAAAGGHALIAEAAAAGHRARTGCSKRDAEKLGRDLKCASQTCVCNVHVGELDEYKRGAGAVTWGRDRVFFW